MITLVYSAGHIDSLRECFVIYYHIMKCIGVKSGCSHGGILKVFFWFSHGLPRGSLFYGSTSPADLPRSPSIQPSASKLVRNIQGLPDLRFVAAFVKNPGEKP